MRTVVLDEVQQLFRPEFLNRLDEMVVFQRLDRAQLAKIVEIQLVGLSRRLSRRATRARRFAGRARANGRTGMGSSVRGAAAQARHSALHRRPARRAYPQGRIWPGDTVVVDRNADGVLTFERKMLN